MNRYVPIVLLAVTACAEKKETKGGKEKEHKLPFEWRWKLAPQEVKVPWGSGQIAFSGELPSGWNRPRDGRLEMPKVEEMIYGSVELSYALSMAKPEAECGKPLDSTQKSVAALKEVAPGRWAVVSSMPDSHMVSYFISACWSVPVTIPGNPMTEVTLRCHARASGPPDDPAVWGQALDVCKSITAKALPPA